MGPTRLCSTACHMGALIPSLYRVPVLTLYRPMCRIQAKAIRTSPGLAWIPPRSRGLALHRTSSGAYTGRCRQTRRWLSEWLGGWSRRRGRGFGTCVLDIIALSVAHFIQRCPLGRRWSRQSVFAPPPPPYCAFGITRTGFMIPDSPPRSPNPSGLLRHCSS